MPRILERAPALEAAAVTGAGEDAAVSLAALRGRWAVIFFYPRDFSVVCPTELRELSKRVAEFRAIAAEPVAVSVDDVETHRRWIRGPLGPVAIPLAADPSREIARAWGVLRDDAGVAERATFVVDPAGAVRYAAYHDPSVGRSVSETLRVLEALQTGAPSPAEWRPGDRTLSG